MKRRSNSRSGVDNCKVVNNEAEFIDQLVKSNPPTKNDDDSGYGEKDRIKMKSFSCEDLIAVGSCSQNRRRQSTVNANRRSEGKSISSSSSSTSEEQISQSTIRSHLCSVNIDGKGQCKLLNDNYENIDLNESVKRHTKTSVHLKVHNVYLTI